MAGQGYKKARECIRKRGRAFADNPRLRQGLTWCRFCDYQTTIHYEVIRLDGIHIVGTK